MSERVFTAPDVCSVCGHARKEHVQHRDGKPPHCPPGNAQPDDSTETALSLAHEISWLATTPSGTSRELKRRNGCVVQRAKKLIALLEKSGGAK